jgi:hypothetical protein
MLRSSLSAFGVIALCATTVAQTDGSSRLHTTTQKPKQITYEMATGTLRPEKGPSAFFGPDVLYNNNCILTTLFFAGMSPTDVFLDNGQVPSSGNGELPGCNDSLLMNGFVFGYCTDLPTIDAMICFYELHDNCTDIALATGTTCWYTLTGLPGSSSGVACWAILVDLMGTTVEWPFLADGDGVWNNAGPLDTFGYTYEILNVGASTSTGIILAGEPIHLGQGCDFAVGSVYELADPTGTNPLGTGYGSTDAFGLMNAGAYVGCFFFGGWPANPWSSYYMVVFGDAGCSACCSTVVCDGTGTNPISCPCGNNNGGMGDQGCVHTGGGGGMLCVDDCSLANFGATASNLPAGNGGIFLTGTVQSGGAAPFDGITCTAGSTLRLQAGFETSSGMRVSTGGAITTEGNTVSPGYFVVGNTYVMVYWFRDVAAGVSPCGFQANFTTTVSFTLT